MFRAKPGTMTTSADMSNLLNSFDEYTTNCSLITPPPYLTGQELITECITNEAEQCIDGKTVCEELNDTVKYVIGKTLDVGPESPTKAYRLRLTQNNTDRIITKYSIEEGDFTNCTERYGGSSVILGSPPYDLRLEVCKENSIK